jgi:peptide/nickel transport system permease protein
MVTALVAILGVALLVFLILHLVPGDPVDVLLGDQADAAAKQEMRRCLHLADDAGRPIPIVRQLGGLAGRIADGTLGRSCGVRQGATVASLVIEVYPYTLVLSLAALLVGFAIALPLGMGAALRRGGPLDLLASTVALGGVAIPRMWLGPVLLLLFYATLEWLPGPADDPAHPAALVLPALTLGAALAAMLSRMIRASLLESLGEDYIRTARAKGVRPRTVVLKHALRNSLVPVITILGLQFGALLTGSIVTEEIFGRPGIGSLLMEAIRRRDQPVVQGCVLVISATYVLVNLLADLAYGLADPRIRQGRSSS